MSHQWPSTFMHDRLRKKVIAEEPFTECAGAQKVVGFSSLCVPLGEAKNASASS